jgi:hypothetical protein
VKAGLNIQAKARQDKADAEAQTRQEQLNEYIKGNMEALPERLRSCGKRTTACEVSSVACQKKSNVDLEGTKAAVVTFEQLSDKIEDMSLEANPEATEAVAGRQELVNVRLSGVADGRRSGAKTVLAPDRSCHRPETTDTSRRPYAAKGKHSSESRQKQIWKRKPESKSLREGTTEALLGVQQGVKGRGARQKTRQRMRRTSDRTARKTLRLKIERRISSSAVGLRELNDDLLWKIRPPPKRKNTLSPA